MVLHKNTQEEHDERLNAVLKTLQDANVTLNEEKCEFSKDNVKFLGHIVGKDGIKIDPSKVTAIREMKEPSDVSELRRFLGMINQVGKYIPKLADLTKPLRDLLVKESAWLWDEKQREAFQTIKEQLTTAPTLAVYDTASETKVSADASSYGIGAVLTQKSTSGEWRPVAYISRALTPTESRYAQIEKEALATTWACERLEDFLIGKQFHIETDHKPLVPLFGVKNLGEPYEVRLHNFPCSWEEPCHSRCTIQSASKKRPGHRARRRDQPLCQPCLYSSSIFRSSSRVHQGQTTRR